MVSGLLRTIWSHGCIAGSTAESGDGWEISDLGSRNGTAVDGSLLKATPVRLKEGAVICLGAYAAVFRLATSVELAAIERDLSEPFAPVPTASPALAAISSKLAKLAPTTGEILLTGETGAGKEVYARAIHDASRREGRFVAINCAALPRELIESELFGFARGAHSEAKVDKRGLIEEAEAGRCSSTRSGTCRRRVAGQAAAVPAGPGDDPAGFDPPTQDRRAGAGRHQPHGRAVVAHRRRPAQ